MGDLPVPPVRQQTTILLVDDDPSMMAFCLQKLKDHGFTVLQAPGSSEALKISADRSGPIHLMIADLFLPPPALQLAGTKSPHPRVHGHDLARQIIDTRPDTRVLLVSAYSDEELASHGIVAGPLPFLRKPFTGEALLQAVEQALAGPAVTLTSKPKAKPRGEGNDVEWFD